LSETENIADNISVRYPRHSLIWGLAIFFVLIFSIGGLSLYVLSDEGLNYPGNLVSSLRLITMLNRDSVSPTALVRQARDAVFDKLDRYSGYVEPKELNRVTEEFSGSYGGIGITIVGHDKGLMVMSVREDGPAGRAGMQTGDIIIKADSTFLEGINTYKATFLLRGEEGTPVHLAIARNSFRDTLQFDLVREKLKLLHIPYAGLTENNSLYIRIVDFEAGLTNELINVLDRLYFDRKDSVKALIIDLRSNPGGLLSEAIACSDIFLDKGKLIVGVKGRSRWRVEEYHSSNDDVTGGLPMAILVNRGSASASEIMAGALKYADRAILIGDTTFGKGLVQEYHGLTDGSGVRLTTARYYFEGGVFINDPSSTEVDSGAGIPPDYFYRSTLADEFPSRLESTLLLRDFALENKEDILAHAPFTGSSTEWLSRFSKYAGKKGFSYESDLTIIANIIKDEIIFKNYSDSALNAIEKIYNKSKAYDQAQFDVYSDYIRQRLYQIAVELEYGTARAYHDAIIPYREDIILAEKLFRNENK